MDLGTSKRRKIVKVEISSLAETYPHNLQMYIDPPDFEISLAQLEELALERLKVLRCLEYTNIKGFPKFSEEWKNALSEEMTKQGLRSIYKMLTSPICKQTEADFQLRKRDHMSHFILRLGYCASEDLRRWFIARELELFKLKFLSLNSEPILDFLRINNLNYSPITSDVKEHFRDGLVISTYGLSPTLFEKTDFYCVSWTEVLDLVRSRRIFIESGNAYIPSSEFVAVISSLFRANLAHALTLTYRELPNLEEDERLLPIIRGLHTLYTGDDYRSKTDGSINIDDMDKIARTSFPLCMRQIHETFRATHHLKHGARQQYGLFIKGIGVSLEDSLRYWREEFCKKMDLDKFEKQYTYSIRHMYGKEGKRADYTPYNCMKIIMANIGPGDQHGCPFKHSDPNVLKNKMLHYGLSSSAINEIMELVQKGHYQFACTKHFELTHNQPPETAVSHPNFYFEQSRIALGLKSDTKQEKTYSQNSSQYSSQMSVSTNTNAVVRKEPVQKESEEDMWGNDADFSGLDFSDCN